MIFHIHHTTEYSYSAPATESFSELRLRPRDSRRQTVYRHATIIEPAVLVEDYLDYFGNHVEVVSIPFRHHQLTVTSVCDVETHPHVDALSGLDLTLSEARQLYRPLEIDLFDFLRPSRYIPFNTRMTRMAAELLPDSGDFASLVKNLNGHIFDRFKYVPGATDVRTPVTKFLEKGKGVCQDFAHLMICLCRNAGIPARYVSGYIETHPPEEDERMARLIGAAASHAWVEIYTPNHYWVGLDPTNNIMEDDRHVQIGLGRDYADVTPLKGRFKGADSHRLTVKVKVQRAAETRDTVSEDRR